MFLYSNLELKMKLTTNFGCLRMNQQLVLREDTNLDVDITEEDVLMYATQLGIDVENEKHLLWIAKEGLLAALPIPWQPVQDSIGRIYYYNTMTEETTWEHPSDPFFRHVVHLQRLVCKANADSVPAVTLMTSSSENGCQVQENMTMDQAPNCMECNSEVGNKSCASTFTLHDTEESSLHSVEVVELDAVSSNIKADMQQSKLTNVQKNITALQEEWTKMKVEWKDKKDTDLENLKESLKEFINEEWEKKRVEIKNNQDLLKSQLMEVLNSQSSAVETMLTIMSETIAADYKRIVEDYETKMLCLHKEVSDIKQRLEHIECDLSKKQFHTHMASGDKTERIPLLCSSFATGKHNCMDPFKQKHSTPRPLLTNDTELPNSLTQVQVRPKICQMQKRSKNVHHVPPLPPIEKNKIEKNENRKNAQTLPVTEMNAILKAEHEELLKRIESMKKRLEQLD